METKGEYFYSKKNDQILKEVPEELKNLSLAEQALISPILPHVQVFYPANSSTPHFSSNIVNIKQNIYGFKTEFSKHLGLQFHT